jgi:hypothetical protein
LLAIAVLDGVGATSHPMPSVASESTPRSEDFSLLHLSHMGIDFFYLRD